MQANEFNYLLNRLKTDKSAFDRLYSYFLPRIILHIRIRFSGKISAEDIAQEFFIKLFSLHTKYVDYPLAWVYRVCDNIALDQLKKEQPTVDIDDVVLVGEIVETPEEKALLEKVLSQIPKNARDIIIMKVVEGYSFVEIAEQTNTNLNTTKSLYRRGMAQAQSLYKQYCK